LQLAHPCEAQRHLLRLRCRRLQVHAAQYHMRVDNCHQDQRLR
jgi:hypothetical protein